MIDTASRAGESTRFMPGRVAARETALVALLAVVQIGGTALASGRQPERGGLGLAGIVLLGIAVGAVPFRIRYPDAALAAVLAATAAYWSLGYPRGPVFFSLIVVFANEVVVGRRRVAAASLVAGFLLFPWLGYVIGRQDSPPSLAAIAGLGAWLVALLSVVELLRSRRDRTREAARSEAEAVRRRAADERMRIARELHDAVAHNMSLINIQAGVALHLADDLPAEARDALTAIKAASKDALLELRSILGVLRHTDEEEPRSPTPTLARIDELIAQAALTGVEVRLDVRVDVGRLPRATDLAAYRIVQESLTNVARHSDDPNATVRIYTDGEVLVVEVLDEGSGGSPGSDLPSGGSGIVGMRERAASVGGGLVAGPRAGRGFAVRAELPLGPQA
jgi:signal transduction histidine kinase